MAATGQALLAKYKGTSVATAFPQVAPNAVGSQNLDLLQIVDNNGESVLLNVDYAGVVHNPASRNTAGVRIGRYRTSLTSSATTAQLFADVFTNPTNLDIIQVANQGSVAYYLDYLGAAH